MESSNYIHKESCPECGSKDNLARYDDGHAYCFGCSYRERGDGSASAPQVTQREEPEVHSGIIPGSYTELTKRGISLATCKAWSYQVGELNGQKVQLANHLDDTGAILAQKVRFANKDFRVTGDKDAMGLYGKHMCRGLKRDKIVITEGEIDALSVWQVAAGQLAVVSLPNGAQSAKKSLAKDLAFLEQFGTIILAFDMDEPGRKAALECAKLFSPGKVRIAELPLKDANDMLKEGRAGELFKALLNAPQHKPMGLVTVADIFDSILEDTPEGLPWWDSRLTALTYGRRMGEIYMFGAGTGVGKTDWLSQQIEFDLNTLGVKVGIFSLEQACKETAKRVAGKAAGKRFHVPGEDWTKAELKEQVGRLRDAGMHMFDPSEACDWEHMASSIRYLYHAEGVTIFYIDHLTALASEEDDEKTGLERIMAEMGRLVKEIPIIIHCVSHLATPEGKPHEEGGRVTIRHFKGSRAIGFWSHYMFGLERNQQDPDPVLRQTTTFRVLKDRFTGQATGQTLPIGYDAIRGRLIPAAPEASPFSSGPNTDFS